MKCFINGSICPRAPQSEIFPGLREMEQTCKFCYKISSDNNELINLLEDFGVDEKWFVQKSLIPEDLQENVTDIVDDILKQGILLKKFVIQEAERFSGRLSKCKSFVEVRKCFDDNWWWLEHIMPDTINQARENLTCDTLMKVFSDVQEVLDWNSGDFFISGIEMVDELFCKLKKIEKTET